MLTFLDYEMIIMYLVYASPVLRVEVDLPVYADPCAGVTAAVPQYVLASIDELDLCVLLTQICALYIHRQVDCVWVPRTKEFTIRRRVNVQKFS